MLKNIVWMLVFLCGQNSVGIPGPSPSLSDYTSGIIKGRFPKDYLETVKKAKELSDSMLDGMSTLILFASPYEEAAQPYRRALFHLPDTYFLTMDGPPLGSSYIDLEKEKKLFVMDIYSHYMIGLIKWLSRKFKSIYMELPGPGYIRNCTVWENLINLLSPGGKLYISDPGNSGGMSAVSFPVCDADTISKSGGDNASPHDVERTKQKNQNICKLKYFFEEKGCQIKLERRSAVGDEIFRFMIPPSGILESLVTAGVTESDFPVMVVEKKV